MRSITMKEFLSSQLTFTCGYTTENECKLIEKEKNCKIGFIRVTPVTP